MWYNRVHSFEFWRLLALLFKRGFSALKFVIFLPFFCIPLVYVSHGVRAALRIYIYIFKTRNKNIGETRKFLFSVVKVVISVIAIGFCCAALSIPGGVLAVFLIYGLVKLGDSCVVFLFSCFTHARADMRRPEDKWRRDQYFDNLVKHSVLVIIGCCMTGATCFLQGPLGAIGVLSSLAGWLSIVIALVVIVASIAYLLNLVYQRHKVGNKDATVKAEYDAAIKRFGKCCAFGLLSLVLFCTVIVVSTAFPGIAPVLWGALIIVYLLVDATKSVYDHFDNKKVADPTPIGLTPKNNAWVETKTHDYYWRKSRANYLNPNKPEENVIYLLKEGSVKWLKLEAKAKSVTCWENKKACDKQEEIVWSIAQVLYRYRGSDNHKLAGFILDAVESLQEDEQTLPHDSKERGRSAIFVTYYDELLCSMASSADNETQSRGSQDNFFIKVSQVIQHGQFDSRPGRAESSQAFFKKHSDTDDLADACSYAVKLFEAQPPTHASSYHC